MYLKLRGADANLQVMLGDKDWDIFVGFDKYGNEVYTGDIVIDDEGTDFEVQLTPDFVYLPVKNLSRLNLKV